MTAASAPVRPNSASEWVRKNLFKNWWSGLITVVAVPVLAYLTYRALRFVFVTAQWEAVRRNLTLFMQGTFARAEQWRIIAQLLLFALAMGIGLGTSRASRKYVAQEAGLPLVTSSPLDTLRRMWSVVLFIAALLFFASTDDLGSLWNPFLLIAAVAALGYIGFQAKRLPKVALRLGWLAMSLLFLVGFQVVSGFDAAGWWPAALILGGALYLWFPVSRVEVGWKRTSVKLGIALVAAIVVRSIYQAVDIKGIGWDKWSGLHLTLMVSALAIVLSFPLGLLLALARRSTLPALRWIATGYIELIRGVPLITLLFAGQFVLPFMLPAETDLSSVSRAVVAMSFFTAAYVAEIVRGGLQALPKGQTEAGQALGLAPPTIMRTIVLPQALRSVIPAMVGQFISLFKDSSLLVILGILEFLGVREIIHAQADFRAVANAETLVFVAFGYWAFAFAMSRESQRLERRLRVSR